MKLPALAFFATGSVILLAGCSTGSGSTSSTSTTDTSSTTESVDQFKNRSPQRTAEIMGTVKQVVGNEFTIEAIDTSGSELLSLSQEDLRTKMQSLSGDQRMTFMQDMQKAREEAPKYLVDVLVPAGIPISLRRGFGGGFGGAAGAGGPGNRQFGGGAGGQQSQGLAGIMGQATTAQNQQQPKGTGTGSLGTLEDIKVGTTVSIRLMSGSDDRKIAEWVNVQPAQGQRSGQGNGQFPGAGGFPGGGQGLPR